MTQAVEVNKFNAGLVTDASPLTTPDNSSLDEDNFVLNIDGSRNRRYGMDYEDGFQKITSPVEAPTSSNVAIRSFKWSNAGGDPDKYVQVVQIGNTLDFFHMDEGALSDGYFHREVFSSSSVETRFSFASVDGMLIVVNGDKDVYIFELKFPNTITRTSRRIMIRDFFGVDDFHEGQDITRGGEVSTRPKGLISSNHLYNLRNQSWAIPRLRGNDEDVYDPLTVFSSENDDTLPSNADTVVAALYPDAEDSDNRVVDRFFSKDLFNNPPGTTRAAQGYFIIDALDRGSSRLAEDAKNRARYPQIEVAVNSLPRDETPSGATAIAEFAGRVFYGGFPGSVIDGDGHSPKLSSYVMFSRLVDSVADITTCYQAGDPTSKEFPDIIDTDGGFIRVNGAYGIQRLVNLGSALMIIAKNGIWRLVGGDNGFTATTYIVEKISDKGCTSPDSIVMVDSGVMYWSDDAIYFVTPDQFGSWQANNISFGKIQKLYDDINIEGKQTAYGEYDSYERKVRWLFYNTTKASRPVRELVLDIQLQAYYTNTVKQLSGTYPKPVCMYIGLSYRVSPTEVDVIVNNEQTTAAGEPVIITSGERLGANQRELGYVVVTSVSPTITYTFAKYSSPRFRDWVKEDGTGVDAYAYLVTSYMSGTDFQRDKQVPYITIHMRRTEIGYTEQMEPINPSSCLVQARWSWSDDDRSGKWGREFQAYRYRRLYLPVDANDDYENGFLTVISRNRLRGNGKVLSLRFRTEPEKDLHLFGWSMIISVAENL